MLPFLTARWSNLCLVTYAVPPDGLRPRQPTGLELDTRDGQAFVSLVAFDFLETRVLGIPWPGGGNSADRRSLGATWRAAFSRGKHRVPIGFPEINLRFYVRRGAERGVVFIREFVPSRFIAWVARTLYNEPYRAAPMFSRIRDTPETLTVQYGLTWAGQEHSLTATGIKPGQTPGANSVEHFFKEHHWGFGISRRGRTLRYQVTHPVWRTYPVQSHRVAFDFGAVYGPEWAFLNTAEPTSTILAEGSPIAVYPRRLEGTEMEPQMNADEHR